MPRGYLGITYAIISFLKHNAQGKSHDGPRTLEEGRGQEGVN